MTKDWTEEGPLPAGTNTFIFTTYTIQFSLNVGQTNPGCIKVKITSSASSNVYPQSAIVSGIVTAANGFGDPLVIQDLPFPAERYGLSTGFKTLWLPLSAGGVATFEVSSNATARAVVDSEHVNSSTQVIWEILAP